jgi:hypothetical protein
METMKLAVDYGIIGMLIVMSIIAIGIAIERCLADVKEFGLSWDDCYSYLRNLGYNVKVELIEV